MTASAAGIGRRGPGSLPRHTLEDYRAAYDAAGGDVAVVADELGMSVRVTRDNLRKLGIETAPPREVRAPAPALVYRCPSCLGRSPSPVCPRCDPARGAVSPSAGDLTSRG